MSNMLQEIHTIGKRNNRSDTDYARTHYIEDPQNISCFVAVDNNGRVKGFQVLKLAIIGNPYNTPAGWGIIGTHISPSAARTGIGRRLFVSTGEAACRARLSMIEAYIQENNVEGVAYYEAIGFRTYRHEEGVVCKSFQIKNPAEGKQVNDPGRM